MNLLKQSTTIGQGLAPIESGWIHHLRLSLRYGIGLPLLVTGLVGVIAIVVRTPGIGAVLFAFPVAYYAVAASVKNLFFRTIPVVPFSVSRGVAGVPSAARFGRARRRRPGRPAAPWLARGVVSRAVGHQRRPVRPPHRPDRQPRRRRPLVRTTRAGGELRAPERFAVRPRAVRSAAELFRVGVEQTALGLHGEQPASDRPAGLDSPSGVAVAKHDAADYHGLPEAGLCARAGICGACAL